MKFEIDTGKIIDNIVSEVLEKEIDGKTLKQWMVEIANRQWISVKDRLPMIDEDVLVFAQGKEDGFILETKIAIAYMTDCTYFGGSPIKVEPRWRCPLQFFLTDYEITHWMPLPEPPKEDDHEAD